MAPRARPGRFRPRTAFTTRARNLLAVASCLALGCAAPKPGEPLERYRDEISVCGELFHTGTRVVLWNDPWGYDAYRVEPHFPAEMSDKDRAAWKPEANYHTIRGNVSDTRRASILDHGWELDWLKEHVDLFVIHYDVSGTSRQCFKVLHDQRHLSVHFMLDVDGTIYQTLDLKERAWHAAEANDRSIGVEIAQVGAYDSPNAPELKAWYPVDADGPRIQFPNWMKTTGIRTPNFVGRPARRGLLSGRIQRSMKYQYDFTEEQYQALAKLTAALVRIFPKIPLTVPRDKNGAVVDHALSRSDFAAFHGILGHYHVTDQKYDPGPAFDWERLLRDARANLPIDAGFGAPSDPITASASVPAATQPAATIVDPPLATTAPKRATTPTKSTTKKPKAPAKTPAKKKHGA